MELAAANEAESRPGRHIHGRIIVRNSPPHSKGFDEHLANNLGSESVCIVSIIRLRYLFPLLSDPDTTYVVVPALIWWYVVQS